MQRRWFLHFVKFFILCLFLVAFSAQEVFADSSNSQSAASSSESEPTTDNSNALIEESNWNTLKNFISWPFIHILQPVFAAAIYPISEPLHYAFDNGVIEKGVEVITFGEKRNIFIYPIMNLKPGTRTMLGFMYRHSDLMFPKDYFVLSGNLFANSDVDYSVRYSRKNLFDGQTYLAFTHGGDLNRDGSFRLPSTSTAFAEPDTTFRVELSAAHPFPFLNNWSVQFTSGVRFKYSGFPEDTEELLDAEYFDLMKERGIYQDYRLYSQSLALAFDNTESPYVATSGSRFQITGAFHIVSNYRDAPQELVHRLSSELNHNYASLNLVWQKYFYLGAKQKTYQFTKKEARLERKKYTDFSLGQTLRMWSPSKISEWIFERRVIAIQLRYLRYWEMDKGGMPALSFPSLNARFPLRGYDNTWMAQALCGISTEYRWPIDYYIDGVAFLEYGMFSDEDGHWNLDNIRNSWGFGVRVRRPDMYFFRLQFGFHGLHGVQLVLTIAPEFK